MRYKLVRYKLVRYKLVRPKLVCPKIVHPKLERPKLVCFSSEYYASQTKKWDKFFLASVWRVFKTYLSRSWSQWWQILPQENFNWPLSNEDRGVAAVGGENLVCLLASRRTDRWSAFCRNDNLPKRQFADGYFHQKAIGLMICMMDFFLVQTKMNW